MRVLVIHQNFPGQFGHFVREWSARQGWEVRGLGRETAPGLPGFTGLTRYHLPHAPNARQHPYLRQMENATLHGQACARAMQALRHSGFTPDIILAHPGWGETLYAKDIYPQAKLVHLCEWYYSADGADLGFDPEFPMTLDARARIRNWNALHALQLTQCDMAISPTQWQRSRHPQQLQSSIHVQHEGIPTHLLGPDPLAEVTTSSGVRLCANSPDQPVITYVARNLEPYRGFHIFMRALALVQQAHPHCHALIVGADEVSYGTRPKDAPNWRSKLLAEVTLAPERTHFLGRIPYTSYQRVLQVSAAHVYLSYPFVLSWSLLEAMACAAPLIAADTAPVREVLQHGHNAKLVDFFDHRSLAESILHTLHTPRLQAPLRRQAQLDAQAYSQANGLAGYERLLGLPVSAEQIHIPKYSASRL